jgi:hypothetical protein
VNEKSRSTNVKKRLGELQQEDERTRIAAQDEHGSKMKDCTSFQKQYEQQLQRRKLADHHDSLHAQ